MMNGICGGGMGFGWIFWVVLFGLILWGVIAIFNKRQSLEKHQNHKPEDDPLDILKKRYAKGEIDSEEFNKMKEELK
ncbi:MAG: SHOCT domain-containing protein [Deltaproteobacteria bacterium]|jgi:putative membrane protein|nr:SHOCT domain-containing protein [Deltaproteobacteria bacterium]